MKTIILAVALLLQVLVAAFTPSPSYAAASHSGQQTVAFIEGYTGPMAKNGRANFDTVMVVTNTTPVAQTAMRTIYQLGGTPLTGPSYDVTVPAGGQVTVGTPSELGPDVAYSTFWTLPTGVNVTEQITRTDGDGKLISTTWSGGMIKPFNGFGSTARFTAKALPAQQSYLVAANPTRHTVTMIVTVNGVTLQGTVVKGVTQPGTIVKPFERVTVNLNDRIAMTNPAQPISVKFDGGSLATTVVTYAGNPGFGSSQPNATIIPPIGESFVATKAAPHGFTRHPGNAPKQMLSGPSFWQRFGSALKVSTFVLVAALLLGLLWLLIRRRHAAKASTARANASQRVVTRRPAEIAAAIAPLPAAKAPAKATQSVRTVVDVERKLAEARAAAEEAAVTPAKAPSALEQTQPVTPVPAPAENRPSNPKVQQKARQGRSSHKKKNSVLNRFGKWVKQQGKEAAPTAKASKLAGATPTGATTVDNAVVDRNHLHPEVRGPP